MHSIFEIIEEKARENRPRIVFPESDEIQILKLAQTTFELGYCRPILLGNREEILNSAKINDINLTGINIVDYGNETLREKYSLKFLEDNKFVTQKAILRKIKDPLYFANCMVKFDDADSTIAGFKYSTGDVLLAASFIIGLKTSVKEPTSFNIVSMPDFNGSEGNTIIFSDVAVNVSPSSEDLATSSELVADAIKKLLNWTPRVAFLSYSTKGSAQSEKVNTVVDALNILKTRRPDIIADGEMQLDVALSPQAAVKKIKDDNNGVAGKANIVIFPDINSGNINIKAVKLFAKANSIGPILLGFNKQISDLSRTASFEHLVGTVATVAAMTKL